MIQRQFFIFLLFFFHSGIYSQNDSLYLNKMVAIITSDNSEHIGMLLSVSDREYYLATKTNGNVYIPKYSIRQVELLTDENFVNNRYIHANRFYPYYNYLTNALPPKKGSVYIRTPLLLTVVAEVNASERLSFSFGSALVFGVGTAVRYNRKTSEKNSFGACAGYGGIMLVLPDAGNDEKQGYYLRGYYTRGKAERNVTFSAGYISNFRGNISSYFTHMGGMIRTGKKSSFVFEGFMLPAYNAGMMGATARLFTKKRKAWDLGLNFFIWEERYTIYPSPVVHRELRAFPIPVVGCHVKL